MSPPSCHQSAWQCVSQAEAHCAARCKFVSRCTSKRIATTIERGDYFSVSQVLLSAEKTTTTTTTVTTTVAAAFCPAAAAARLTGPTVTVAAISLCRSTAAVGSQQSPRYLPDDLPLFSYPLSLFLSLSSSASLSLAVAHYLLAFLSIPRVEL